MFWKLYRNSLEQDMTQLSQLLADFFAYAASQGGTALDESAFRRDFPQGAQWLLEQFHGQQKNREDLQRAVEELFRQAPARRQAIAQAVAHDMDFDSAANPDCFFFAVPSLPAAEQSIVKEFFRYFYDEAFHRRRGPKIFGHVSGANREGFSASYYQANGTLLHSACPVCLHLKSNHSKENTLEHYFPKGVYSPLYLHPSNLFFVCKDCNSTYKGISDVLYRGTQPLSKTFLPYRDTVKEHAAVVFRRESNTDRVKLIAMDATAEEQERIANFDHQYKLEERWSSDIAEIFERIRKLCAGGLSKEEVRRKLDSKYEELQTLSEFPDRFLESAYLHWLCETMFDAFYDSLN